MKSLKLTLKPVGDGCNLACKHCNVAGEPKKISLIDSRTLENTYELLRGVEKPQIVFHGGEPLLMGHNCFDEAMELAKRVNPDIPHIIQTNLTTLNDGWVQRFRDNDIGIGTSFEGLEEIHDAIRVYPDGRGSHAKVLEGMQMLRDAGLGFGVIATFTRQMVGRVDDVYDAMKEHGIDKWKLLGFTKSGRGTEVDEEIGTTVDEYTNAFIRLADRYFWDNDNPPTIGNIARFAKLYFNLRAGKREKTHCQDAIIAVDNIGNVYPCNKMTEMPDMVIGNVNENTAEEIFDHPTKHEMKQEFEDCPSCEYRDGCSLGCPYDSLIYEGDFGRRDVYCSMTKRFFAHMDNIIRGEIDGRKIPA